MASFKKRKLSGSTNGKGILVAATATPGTLIHTAVAGVIAGTFDEVYLYVVNTSATGVKLTIEWGGVGSPDDHVEFTPEAEAGLVLIIPGLVLQNGLVIRAFAGTTNVLVVHGFVNTITD